ncbi:hypothetical protein XBJ2_170021 [Xenorhabdus bovienii str. Jollieti]|nr:hypothetical protein XBJ2_170021 [Xenorhabdus bovienii str. Jollieti]
MAMDYITKYHQLPHFAFVAQRAYDAFHLIIQAKKVCFFGFPYPIHQKGTICFI